MSAALLVAVLAADSTTLSGSELERMNRVLAHAHEVRVEWVGLDSGDAAYVTRPHAIEAGLDYERIPGRTPLRFRFTGLTVQDPPRPIPWSAIERIEWRRGGTGTGIVVGVLTTAAILVGVGAMIDHSGTDVGPNAAGVILGAVGGGALAGVIASGIAAKTEVIYAAP